MYIYFSAESILINLLSYYGKVSDGIDLQIIQKYCSKIKKELYENRNYKGLVFFESTEQYIHEYTNQNRDNILTVLSRYYCSSTFNGDYLIEHISMNDETMNMMKLVASQLD